MFYDYHFIFYRDIFPSCVTGKRSRGPFRLTARPRRLLPQRQLSPLTVTPSIFLLAQHPDRCGQPLWPSCLHLLRKGGDGGGGGVSGLQEVQCHKPPPRHAPEAPHGVVRQMQKRRHPTERQRPLQGARLPVCSTQDRGCQAQFGGET